jgi:hypothetical protein
VLLASRGGARLLLRARGENEEAEQKLTRQFELQTLEGGAETVAEGAQTRSTSHDDVSAHHGRRMRSSSNAGATAEAERRKAC